MGRKRKGSLLQSRGAVLAITEIYKNILCPSAFVTVTTSGCNTKYLRNVYMYFTLRIILQEKGRRYTHVMMRNLEALRATLLYRIH